MPHPARPAARSIAELVGTAIDPLLRKRGLARAELISWWPDIVGKVYAERTVPERIRWPRDGTAATLIVACDPALALQLSYETDRVRERLNSYFGYPAVGAVKIVQRRIGTDGPPAPARDRDQAVDAAVDRRVRAIEGPIGDSLRELGRAVLSRS